VSLHQLLERARADWVAEAICSDLDPREFFPIGDDLQERIVDSICVLCPVRAECVEHAAVNRIDHGVWGSTEKDRRWLLRARRAAPDRPLLDLLQRRRGELEAGVG
jgi:WhiB family redox-sensing transcriptional regulator